MTNSNSHAVRLPWVDMGKGIAMFLVILFHCENSLRGQYVVEHYSAFYHPFFLPLFFFLSGYLFTSDYKKFSFGRKSEQVVRGIVVPYFIFTLLILLPKSFFHDVPVSQGVKEILLGQASWFIVSLGISQTLFAAILSKTKSLKLLAFIAVIFLLCGYLIKLIYPFRLPFYLNYCPIVYIWIFMGFLYRIYEKRLAILSKPAIVVCLIGLYSAALWIDSVYFHTTLNLFEERAYTYNHYLLSITYSFIGVSIMVSLLKMLPSISAISFIGINSLTIYYVNGGICKITALLVNKVDFFCHPRHTYAGVILVAILCVCIAACLAYFIRRYFPLLVGDKMAFERLKNRFQIFMHK